MLLIPLGLLLAFILLLWLSDIITERFGDLWYLERTPELFDWEAEGVL